jgi:hypothetical protein
MRSSPTTQMTSRVALFPITRQAVRLTALGEQVAALIDQQQTLPEGSEPYELVEREIDAMLGLDARP